MEIKWGIDEVKEPIFWKALVAEAIGTGFLVLVGCGTVTDKSSIGEIAFAFGLIVGLMIQGIGHISGGNINPAVTIAFMVTGNTSIIRAFLYVISQLVGAVVGAALLYAVTPSDSRGSLGQTNLNPNVTEVQGLFIEIFITFVLVFVVYSIVDPNRPEAKAVGPVVIGLSVAACHLWAIKYTGSSMNTARTFGPALIANRWDHHWVYWVGPIIGGIVAGLLYKLIFTAPVVILTPRAVPSPTSTEREKP